MYYIHRISVNTAEIEYESITRRFLIDCDPQIKKNPHLLAVTTDRFHPRVGEGLFNKLSRYVPFPLFFLNRVNSRETLDWKVVPPCSSRLQMLKKTKIMSTYGIVYKNN